jgi:hypothetical protein
MIKVVSLISISIVLLVFTINLNAFIAGNESENAYCGGNSGIPCTPDPLKTSSIKDVGETGPTIRELIVEGGGYLLQSSSDINGFFNKIELAELSSNGPDYKILQGAIRSAIYNMEKTRTTYYQLKTLANVTPYNQEVIFKLVNFDYDSFQQENGLFPAIFGKVKGLLIVGNVTGVYDKFYSYTGQILDLLYTLKKDIDAEIFPDISNVWSVNQIYSEFKLLGQYVAQVFYSIKEQ